MKTVAIITEYNPFHTGHEYQVNKIREEFGADTRIVAIMSGNFTQRGEIAYADKYFRAECAVRCGVNLVLELPFPFSSSNAEIFAKSGVRIIDSLGVVDAISFGSEMGDISKLVEISANISSAEYQKKVGELVKINSSLGYPKLCEMAYNELFGESVSSDFFTPNNILALEYIRAVKSQASALTLHTIKRVGAGYNEQNLTEAVHQSASAIRTAISVDIYSATKNIPQNAKEAFISTYQSNLIPCDEERLSSAVISFFRLNSSPLSSDILDAAGGLYNRLQSASFEAETIKDLIKHADTKKYTTARIRRAMWNSFFGVTSSEAKNLPEYTQVLAMDTVGQAILKQAKKVTDFPILTKPSSYAALSETAKKQKEKSDMADSVFQLTKPSFTSGRYSLKCTPYIK